MGSGKREARSGTGRGVVVDALAPEARRGDNAQSAVSASSTVPAGEEESMGESKDVYVGRDYGRHDMVIDADEVAMYCSAVDDHNAMYTGPSPFGGAVAPALVRHSEVYAYREHPKAGAPAWYLPNLYGNLHARQEWELFAPVMVGDAVNTRSVISDRYVKRGRDYVVNEVLYFDADGRVVQRGRTHQSFLRETDNRGIVVDKTREKAVGRGRSRWTRRRRSRRFRRWRSKSRSTCAGSSAARSATTTTTRRWP